MSDAQDILKRMRSDKDKDKKERPTINPEDLKVRLIVYPLKRNQLVFWLILAFAAFLTILARDLHADKSWLLTSLPIIGLGLMMCAIPATEAWEYKPWQTRARQYERHQLER